MAQQGDSSDLIMKFVLDSEPIPADSTTELASLEGAGNPLLAGFRKGCMFEVDRFTFRAGTQDDDSAGNTAAQARPVKGGKAQTAGGNQPPLGYKAWRAGKDVKYPVDLQPVSFTRSVDSASQILIQNCIDCVSYDHATLIKRKAAGGVAAGEVFLRLDFIGVLVTGVEWTDDSLVSETGHFICRSVIISYRPQLPDGTLGAVVSGFWSMLPNAKQPPLA